MEHLILTETEFFRLIDNPDSRTELGAAYNEFTTAVVSLCTGATSPCHPLPALSYVETELQYHKAIRDPNTEHSIYVRKALAFVRRMLKIITIPHSQVPPLSSIPFKDEKKDDTPADALLMRWTGNLSDFVEMVYGLDSLKCINGGETGVTELLLGFGKLFGLKLKDKQCYNAYADIKRRKSDSRTYFFDKAAEKLNRRMQEDEERERMRKR